MFLCFPLLWMISGCTVVARKEKLRSVTVVCPLGSTLRVEGVLIVSCWRVFPLLLVFVECWLWTQGLEGAVVGSEVNGLFKNRVVRAVARIWW